MSLKTARRDGASHRCGVTSSAATSTATSSFEVHLSRLRRLLVKFYGTLDAVIEEPTRAGMIFQLSRTCTLSDAQMDELKAFDPTMRVNVERGQIQLSVSRPGTLTTQRERDHARALFWRRLVFALLLLNCAALVVLVPQRYGPCAFEVFKPFC